MVLLVALARSLSIIGLLQFESTAFTPNQRCFVPKIRTIAERTTTAPKTFSKLPVNSLRRGSSNDNNEETLQIEMKEENAVATSTEEVVEVEDDNILLKLANDEEINTQTKLTPEQVKEYNNAIDKLPNPPDSLDVNGQWRLLATISPEAEEGDNVDFFDIQSWEKYIRGTGPSPFQSLITGSSRVNGLSQWLSDTNFDNIVEFVFGPITGTLVLKASLEDVNNNQRTFRFQNGFFLLKTVWDSSITVPYPVPFWLLGDRAVGWLTTIGYDERTGIRAAIGNKGTKFIFQKKKQTGTTNTDDNSRRLEEDIRIASQLYDSNPEEHETNEEEQRNNEGLTKRPIILCPQQFGGKPGDYTTLIRQLRDRGHPVYLARIGALQWLSIVKSVPTEAYFKGELEPSETLPFYMDAINDAIHRMDNNYHHNNGEDNNDNNNNSLKREYSILSHSIGGWIARAWLGEVAEESVRNRCKRYVSLGTPHVAPPNESIVSKVDQTRGLLKYINDRWPGAYYSPDIQYTCVASNGVTGQLRFDLDSILGFSSYFALGGDGNVEGDGITPIETAIFDGAKSIVLGGSDTYHADIVPNPIGARNKKLIGCKWYADKIDEWADAL